MSQLASRESEMVILHEYEGIRTRGFVGDGCGETPVGRLIGKEIPRPKDRLHANHMTQGPQPFVGKAVVVAAIVGV
jgi:hypothetical protein